MSHREKTSLLYDYEFLLDRLYSKLTVRTSKSSRFELPQLQTERVGRRTLIKNFRQLANSMRREPKILLTYLMKEIGTSGSYEEESGIAILHARVTSSALNSLIHRFVKTYVICPTCGAPDTKLEYKKKEAWILVCEACGAEQPVPPV